MVRLSLMEQIEMFLSMVRNSNEAKYIIPIIILISILLIIGSIMKKKVIKVIYMFIYIAIIGIISYMFHEPLLKMFDYLIENIVNNILFPNVITYVVMLLITNIIVIKSILSNKTNSLTKSVNIINFSLINLLLFFIVKTIFDNNIDIYEKLNVYTNQDLLVLIELSMILFVIWIFILTFINIVSKIVNVIENRKVIVKEKDVVVNNIPLENVIEDIIPKKKEIVNNNRLVLSYELDDNNELIEYVPIKKKEFRVSK